MNIRIKARIKTARENGERRFVASHFRLARFTREDRTYRASALPKTIVLQSRLLSNSSLYKSATQGEHGSKVEKSQRLCVAPCRSWGTSDKKIAIRAIGGSALEDILAKLFFENV